jgi:hypothetical protein
MNLVFHVALYLLELVVRLLEASQRALLLVVLLLLPLFLALRFDLVLRLADDRRFLRGSLALL